MLLEAGIILLEFGYSIQTGINPKKLGKNSELLSLNLQIFKKKKNQRRKTRIHLLLDLTDSL